MHRLCDYLTQHRRPNNIQKSKLNLTLGLPNPATGAPLLCWLLLSRETMGVHLESVRSKVSVPAVTEQSNSGAVGLVG